MKRMPRIWEQNELDFLIANYAENGVLYCVKQLNRRKDSIKHKARKLNLKLKSKRYEKEFFVEIIKNSRSYSDAVRKLKLNDGHGNRQTIVKYINLYDIDISHFDYKDEIVHINKKIDLKDILVENSSYNRTRLKERLYEEDIKKRNCEKCGQGEIWNGEKMSLILDHANGIHNDNRIENLRILCPNCSATLPTHGEKNRKQ